MEVRHRTSKAMDEENKQFVSNFFYTTKDSNGILDDEDDGTPPTLKINPEHPSRDPYCLPGGCGAHEVISACESATKYADLLFNWVGVKDKTKNANRIIDPKLSDSAGTALNPKWMAASWRGTVSGTGGSEQSQKSSQIFTPPRLSVRYAEQPQDNDLFCSPESTTGDVLGGEEGTILPTCPEFQDGTACDPDIQTNLVCSPEQGDRQCYAYFLGWRAVVVYTCTLEKESEHHAQRTIPHINSYNTYDS